MNISVNYIAIVPVEKEAPKNDEFQTVEIQDDTHYKGKVHLVSSQPVYMGNQQLMPGNTILFAKYSPDTHDVTHDGVKMKFIKTSDILAVL